MISIIVPIYNVEQYLPRCLDSIVNQTLQDLEIILVDDGSSDCCGEICDAYAQKDKRIIVYHTANGGLSAARNYGMARARGDYLGFVDSDDWIDPEMFEILLRQMEDNQADVSISGFKYEYPERAVVASIADEQYVNHDELLKALLSGNLGGVIWNKLYRKKSFKDTVFPEGHVFEDIATL